jgi:hypothetical protein
MPLTLTDVGDGNINDSDLISVAFDIATGSGLGIAETVVSAIATKYNQDSLKSAIEDQSRSLAKFIAAQFEAQWLEQTKEMVGAYSWGVVQYQGLNNPQSKRDVLNELLHRTWDLLERLDRLPPQEYRTFYYTGGLIVSCMRERIRQGLDSLENLRGTVQRLKIKHVAIDQFWWDSTFIGVAKSWNPPELGCSYGDMKSRLSTMCSSSLVDAVMNHFTSPPWKFNIFPAIGACVLVLGNSNDSDATKVKAVDDAGTQERWFMNNTVMKPLFRDPGNSIVALWDAGTN